MELAMCTRDKNINCTLSGIKKKKKIGKNARRSDRSRIENSKYKYINTKKKVYIYKY